jgi:hypothetical protein
MSSYLDQPVQSRDDFVRFINVFVTDFRQNSELWENQTLEHFLVALGAWVEDMDGYYTNQGKSIPHNIDWGFVKDLLLASKVYE